MFLLPQLKQEYLEESVLSSSPKLPSFRSLNVTGAIGMFQFVRDVCVTHRVSSGKVPLPITTTCVLPLFLSALPRI